MMRSSRAFFSSGVSSEGGDAGFGLAGGVGVLSAAPESAGTVVPAVELPEGALPVSAA
jgi:hypothetical protein